MKSVFTKALVAGIAVLLVAGAIASASASASECPGTGEGVVLCSGGHVQEGTFGFTGQKKLGTTSEYEIVGVLKINCGAFTSKGQFVATKSGVEVTNLVTENKQCGLGGHPNCTVKPLIFGVGQGLRGVLPSPAEIALYPMTGEQFSEISVSGCEQEYSKKVAGHQTCSLPSSTVEAPKHEQVCASGGSKLTAGTRSVIFAYAEEIALSSGQNFSLQRG